MTLSQTNHRAPCLGSLFVSLLLPYLDSCIVSDLFLSLVMSFDRILEHVGASGRYQILILLLMNFLKMYPGYETLMPVIVAYKQDHRCRLGNFSVPGNGSIVLGECHIFRNETPLLRVPCTEWDYDKSVMHSTIRSQFNLVCDREYLASLSTTFFFAGFVIGCTLYGAISDRYGRLVGILTSTAHLFIFSLGAAFAQDFWTFASVRLIGGIGNGGLLSTLFTMAAEVTDPEHRAFYSLMVHNGFSIGGLYLSLCGYLLRDHFWVQIALALPMLLVVFMPLIVHESPRWLLTTGRYERAEKVIRAIARTNGKTLPPDFNVKQVEMECHPLSETDGGPLASRQSLWKSFCDLFKTMPMALTTMIVWYNWLVVSMSYFAIYFTLGNLGGIIFINLCISCAVEVPSRTLAVYVTKWWGRIPTIVVCYAFGGLACLVNAVIISFGQYAVALQVFSLIGKFFLNAAFDMIWFYSGEVFPTVIRNIGVGIGSTWARIGGTLAPQAALLFKVWKPAPLIILGTLPIIAAFFSLLLPETKDKALPETLEDGASFVRAGWRWKRASRRREGQNEATA